MQLHRFDSQKSGYDAQKKPKSGGRGAWRMLASAYGKMSYRKSKQTDQSADSAAPDEGDPQEGEEEEEEGVVIVDHNMEVDGTAREGSGGDAPVSHVSTDGASTSGRSGWINWFGRASGRGNASTGGAAQGGGDKVDSAPESEAAKEHVQVPERGEGPKSVIRSTVEPIRIWDVGGLVICLVNHAI